MVQLLHWMDIVGRLLPLVLTVAVIFTFFLVQGFARKLSRMEFYLDRIDNHLREITYFIKEHRAEKCGNDDDDQGAGAQDGGSGQSTSVRGAQR